MGSVARALLAAAAAERYAAISVVPRVVSAPAHPNPRFGRYTAGYTVPGSRTATFPLTPLTNRLIGNCATPQSKNAAAAYCNAPRFIFCGWSLAFRPKACTRVSHPNRCSARRLLSETTDLHKCPLSLSWVVSANVKIQGRAAELRRLRFQQRLSETISPQISAVPRAGISARAHQTSPENEIELIGFEVVLFLEILVAHFLFPPRGGMAWLRK